MLLKDDVGNIKECMHFVHNFNCFHLSVPMGCKVRMAYSALTLFRLLNCNEFLYLWFYSLLLVVEIAKTKTLQKSVFSIGKKASDRAEE
jgi:hypothetical protein